MKLHQALIALAVTAATAIGGGFVVAQVGRNQAPGNAAGPSNTPPPSTSRPTTAPPNTPPPNTSSPVDELSEENVIRERLYFDVTGHSFSSVKPARDQVLSACTGDRTFADSLPRKGVTTLSSTLVAEGGRKVVNQVAQTASAGEARAAAEEIVTLVVNCPAISGGDFGYGDPVTVLSDAKREIIYLPAFDSDQAAGGYIVVQVGNRVSVVDVNDGISAEQVEHLARETASITEA